MAYYLYSNSKMISWKACFLLLTKKNIPKHFFHFMTPIAIQPFALCCYSFGAACKTTNPCATATLRTTCYVWGRPLWNWIRSKCQINWIPFAQSPMSFSSSMNRFVLETAWTFIGLALYLFHHKTSIYSWRILHNRWRISDPASHENEAKQSSDHVCSRLQSRTIMNRSDFDSPSMSAPANFDASLFDDLEFVECEFVQHVNEWT